MITIRKYTQGNRPESPDSCLSCVHASAPLTNSAGNVIGQSDCGCGGRATGRTWVTCGVTGYPVEIRKALRCGEYIKSNSHQMTIKLPVPPPGTPEQAPKDHAGGKR